jgi:hypothetical protein
VSVGGKLKIAARGGPGSPAEGAANSLQHHQDSAGDGTVAAVTSLLTIVKFLPCKALPTFFPD